MSGQSLPRNVQQKKHLPKRVANRNAKKSQRITDTPSLYKNISSKRWRVAKLIVYNILAGTILTAIFVLMRNILEFFGKEDAFAV